MNIRVLSLSRCFVVVLAVLSSVNIVAAERVALDWRDDTSDAPPTPRSGDVLFIPIGKISARILDSSTMPASPFENGQKVLGVERGDEANDSERYKVLVKPFLQGGMPPKKGWIECEMALSGPNNFVNLSASGDASALLTPASASGKSVIWMIMGANAKPLIIVQNGDSTLKRHAPVQIIEGQPFKLRIEWNFESQEPDLHIMIDGEVIVSWRSDYPNISLQEPVDIFSISLRSGFLGKIVVSE